MVTTAFKLGTLTLPDDLARLAEDVCTDHGLTSFDLFCKWEAWALSNNKSTDLPTADDLHALSAHIRTKAAKTAARAPSTPSSARKRHVAASQQSPLYRPSPTPTRVNVDDFFNYVDEEPPSSAPDADAATPSRSKRKRPSGATSRRDDDDGFDFDEQQHPSPTQNGLHNPSPGRKRLSSPVPQPNFDDDALADAPQATRRAATPSKARGKPGLLHPADYTLAGDDSPDALYARRPGAGRVETSFTGPHHYSGGVAENDPKTEEDTLGSNDDDHDTAAAASATARKQTHAPNHRASPLSFRVRSSAARDQRYMNDALSARADAARARITALGNCILANVARTAGGRAELPPCTPEAFTVPSPNRVLAVGRVRADPSEPDADGGGGVPLNAASAQLESAEGNVLSLNLSRLRGQHDAGEAGGLFLCAGMVVVVDGVNTNSRVMDVHAVYDDAMLPLPASVPDAPPVVAKSSSKIPVVRVLAAAGQFTTATNLLFEPLADLLAVVRKSRPDVVLLSGPFLSAAHKLVSDTTPVPFADIVRDRVLQPVLDMLRELRDEDADAKLPTVVVQPALDDVSASFVAPQPPLKVELTEESGREGVVDGEVHLAVQHVGNPAVLELGMEINEPDEDDMDGGEEDDDKMEDVGKSRKTVKRSWRASIGLSGLPVMKDVSQDCVVWGVDRFEAIAGCVVKQRCVYPCSPSGGCVPVDSGLRELLDLPASEETKSVDLLVIPSRVKAFAKGVHAGVLAVNPGPLCRGAGGGTYAEVELPLHRVGERRNERHVIDRASVNIVRL